MTATPSSALFCVSLEKEPGRPPPQPHAFVLRNTHLSCFSRPCQSRPPFPSRPNDKEGGASFTKENSRKKKRRPASSTPEPVSPPLPTKGKTPCRTRERRRWFPLLGAWGKEGKEGAVCGDWGRARGAASEWSTTRKGVMGVKRGEGGDGGACGTQYISEKGKPPRNGRGKGAMGAGEGF